MAGERQGRGPAPYGFRWNGGELVQVPEEAKTLKLVFELYRKQQSYAGVAAELTRLEVAPPRGDRWWPQQIGRMVAQSSAIGRYESSGRAASGDAGSAEKEVVRCTPVVSQELWDAVVAIRSDGEAKRKGGRPLMNALAGLVYCCCGSRMEVPSAGTKKYVCPECRQKIPVEQLDEIIARALARFTAARTGSGGGSPLDPEVLKLAGELRAVEHSLAEAEREMKKLEALVLDQKLDEDRFAHLHALRTAECEKLRREQGRIDKAMANRAGQRGESPTLDESSSDQVEFLRVWRRLAVKTQRGIIAKLLDQIVVDAAQGTIMICSPFEDLFSKAVTVGEQTKTRTSEQADRLLAGAPALMSLPKAGERCPYTGMSRSALNALILESANGGAEPPVKSKRIVKEGKKRGLRRIHRDSLAAYLDKQSK